VLRSLELFAGRLGRVPPNRSERCVAARVGRDGKGLVGGLGVPAACVSGDQRSPCLRSGVLGTASGDSRRAPASERHPPHQPRAKPLVYSSGPRLAAFSASSPPHLGYPRVHRDLVVAVTDGDMGTEVSAVDQCLQNHYGAVNPMDLVPEDVVVCPIEFWLDPPGMPSWKSLAHVGEQVCFLLDETTALVREGG
jgi:hypothetical protein